ncbi:MAG: LCP family protein [Candidatus Uhrbacteria bacterium]|nr:LCP family protein [Candidatus Uhrbacteria bacterium]
MFRKHPRLAVNFLTHSHPDAFHRRTVILAAIFALCVSGIAALGAHASYQAAAKGRSVLQEMGDWPVISDIRHGVFGGGDGEALTNTPDHRLNILVLGIGGAGHDGPELTDTILLASLDLEKKKVALLSIPRDLAYPLGSGRFEKINAVHAYAEQAHPGEGARRTAEAFAKLLDIRIDHVARIDFRGFAAFIDAIDGIDVDVERSFTDPEFPLGDSTTTLITVSFKKGRLHMDGATALTFVRSRHGTNGEGSDFARSRRQQMVILAVRQKLLSVGTLTDPSKLSTLYTVIANHLQTDLTPWGILKLAPLMSQFSSDHVVTQVLSDDPDGQLISANVGGSYMLFPRKPDWSEIRELAQNPFVKQESNSLRTPHMETVKIEIRNGTLRTGFASHIAAKLEKNGYEIVALGNARHRGYERSLIFDLTGNKKSAELARLRKMLGADLVQNANLPNLNGSSLPQPLYTNTFTQERPPTPGIDFVVILGEASVPFSQN